MDTGAQGGRRMTATVGDRPGTLIISLDFELHWGMRDHTAAGTPSYTDLARSRRTVADLAARFAGRGIRATWATVGMLFASSGAELQAHRPVVRPTYARPELDPYVEEVGPDEVADPEHLAGSLVDLLAATPGQEVASHTFSHYYCLEEGQTEEQFRADLAAARSIASARGLELTSLVLPRNQWNAAYAEAVADAGFTSFRGPQPSRGHQANAVEAQRTIDRAARLLDTYAGLRPPPTFAWHDRMGAHGLCDLPASAFLRPWAPNRRALEPLRLRRLGAALRVAARQRRIVHLWWHPHNFTRHPDESFALLDGVLDEFDRLASTEGMQSATMQEVAVAIRAGRSSGPSPRV